MATNRINIEQRLESEVKSTLLYVSESEYGQDWYSYPHIHPFAEIFYVTTGHGQFWIEDKTYPVSQDDLILINSNINHTEMSLNDQPFSYIVMGISGIDFQAMNAQSFSIQNVANYKHELLFFIKNILVEAKQKDESTSQLVHLYLDILLININRRYKGLVVKSLNNAKLNLECNFVKEYIDKNYQQNINLDHLASLTHTSKFYLSHEFKETMGISIIEYLLQRRIKEACSLLETTNYSISTISSLVGYASPAYFSSAFQKRMKKSPLEYKRQFRKDIQHEQ